MPQRLPPLNALRAFETVARHLSFRKAAEELHVTPAAVSQQIKTLEDYLGFHLFHRIKNTLSLTEAAQAGLPRITEGLECLVRAAKKMRDHHQSGGLTICTPPSFAAKWLVPRLPRFIDRHPDINLRILASIILYESHWRITW
jgi:LysR family glycine cleavage system transcriptional activator